MDWRFSWMEKKRKREGMIGIIESAASLNLVYGVLQREKLVVKAHQRVVAPTLSSRQAALKQFVIMHDLLGVETTYVLNPVEYHLTLLEEPLVAKEEVSQAIRWLLKDSINYPIENAIVESFEVPYPRAKDNSKMVYAVAMNKNIVVKVEALVNPSGATLKYIDIPELALCNLINENKEMSKGCVFVQLEAYGGKIILCRHEEICIARSIDLKLKNLGENKEDDNALLETLALEIQRSFDYLNSVFRQSVQNVIVLAPSSLDNTLIKTSLSSALGAEVSLLNLEELVSFETPLSEAENKESLLAIGAILRQRKVVS